MVKIDESFTSEDNIKYSNYFEKYPYELSIFQKFALKAIIEGQHSLSCVPTGSGKTLPALFAIDYFTNQNKKVIYTSPIKALSNQKYYEFTQKFPGISIGLLTGDIKINPEADVLIMTAEILQNTLYRKKQNNNGENKALLMFDMDFDNELACVIQDEVHMINDADRGHVWESTILLLPPHIQMVMLSATLDRPEKFAEWIESRGNTITDNEKIKEVYLATSSFRPVPLTHYTFITTPQSYFKSIKDKELEQKTRNIINKPHVLLTSNGEFKEETYYKIIKTIDSFQKNKTFIKRSFVLNETCKYMFENNMLPAVCFILSRKQIYIAAHEINTQLFEDDSKVPYIVKKECEQIIRAKISNYEEYLQLPEYIDMIKLLEKGIAIHHSGVMPILREIVELLFEKGYIKLLFATETFSVGLNMPIKTVIFTDVKKFDGSGMRMLHPHEFIQASGRAGRRGIDTIGNVIHLQNLYRNVELSELRNMMKGKPQTLISKFKISYELIINLVDIGETDYTEFCKRSMIQSDINSELTNINKSKNIIINELNTLKDQINNTRTPMEIINKYISNNKIKNEANNKKRKIIEREQKEIEDYNKFLKQDTIFMQKYIDKEEQLNNIEKDYFNTSSYIEEKIQRIFNLLINENFIEHENNLYTLTTKGTFASYIREVHCLTFSNIYKKGLLTNLSSEQLISIFSCFTNISVSDDLISCYPSCNSTIVNETILKIKEMNLKYYDFEVNNQLNTGVDYIIHYDLLEYIPRWCESTNISECKQMIQDLEYNKGIFLGEFVKAILKINNISSELEKIAEYMNDITFLHTLREIPEKTLKYVITNQSLYI